MSDPEGYRFLPHDTQRCQCEGCQRVRRGAIPTDEVHRLNQCTDRNCGYDGWHTR